jgi:NADH-quinone oxidoreductase subunit G
MEHLPWHRLALVEDRRGKPNNGMIGVWSRANDQAAWEMGYKTETDLASALKGKVVYIAAADPAGDESRLASALSTARAVVVQELFLTATARLADIVLPALAFTEREGSYTSGERRVQRFSPALTVKNMGKPDFSITALVADELGIDLEGDSQRKVMDRMAVLAPAFAGISYAKLAEVCEQWPIIGRPDLYYGGTSYQNTQGLGVHLGQPVGKA